MSRPDQVGFVPKDISATFSVDDNVYIIYSGIKIEYSLYDAYTGKSNYIAYNPSNHPSNHKNVCRLLLPVCALS